MRTFNILILLFSSILLSTSFAQKCPDLFRPPFGKTLSGDIAAFFSRDGQIFPRSSDIKLPPNIEITSNLDSTLNSFNKYFIFGSQNKGFYLSDLKNPDSAAYVKRALSKDLLVYIKSPEKTSPTLFTISDISVIDLKSIKEFRDSILARFMVRYFLKKIIDSPGDIFFLNLKNFNPEKFEKLIDREIALYSKNKTPTSLVEAKTLIAVQDYKRATLKIMDYLKISYGNKSKFNLASDNRTDPPGGPGGASPRDKPLADKNIDWDAYALMLRAQGGGNLLSDLFIQHNKTNPGPLSNKDLIDQYNYHQLVLTFAQKGQR